MSAIFESYFFSLLLFLSPFLRMTSFWKVAPQYDFLCVYYSHAFMSQCMFFACLFCREQWKGYVPQYQPVFMDGWSPTIPDSNNLGAAVASEAQRRMQERIIQAQHEVRYTRLYIFLYSTHHVYEHALNFISTYVL